MPLPILPADERLPMLRVEAAGRGCAVGARARVRAHITLCLARMFCGALCAALAACSGKPEPKAPEPERTAFLAQPCAGLALEDAVLDADKARVFVEVAEVSTRDLPRPIGRWLDENSVQVRSTANLVVFPNVPTSMPWGQCVDAVCSSMKRSITLTAQLPERTLQPVPLTLRIDEAADGSQGERRMLLDTTLRALHQEPVVLPPSPEVSDGSVIVTAYLLLAHDDLHRILECQARRSQ